MRLSVVLLALLSCTMLPATAAEVDLERARMLYENHCRMCHDSIAFKRDKRIANSYAEIKAQVTRWQTNTGLHWNQADIDSVTAYVADKYYQIPVPASQ